MMSSQSTDVAALQQQFDEVLKQAVEAGKAEIDVIDKEKLGLVNLGVLEST